MRILFTFLFVLLYPVAATYAAPPASVPASQIVQGDLGDLKHTFSARIDKVIDGQTVILNNDRIIRLSGILSPAISRTPPDQQNLADAKIKLEQLLPPNTDVMVYQTRNAQTGRTDRMGNHLAHLVIRSSGQWVNGALVHDGFAYVFTDRTNPEMKAQLYTLEDRARKAGRGIWTQGSPYRVLQDTQIPPGYNGFAIVEGKVLSATPIDNQLYLNFGKDRRKDFTVKIRPLIRRHLARNGTPPMELTGHRIRVRGWLRQWDGPFLELELQDHLEDLDKPPQ